MKKSFVFLLVISLLIVSSTLPASAVNTTVGSTTVTTSIDPTYTVTVPADTHITFNTLSTGIGELKLASARLDPRKSVHVTAAYTSLKNGDDASKTISYTLKSAGDPFTGAYFQNTSEKAVLSVDITQVAWDGAFAGSYSDIISFTVSYDDLPR